LFQDLSPLKNAGVEVGLTTDYFGTAVPQGSAPDMGIYEKLLLQYFASTAGIVSFISDPIIDLGNIRYFLSTAGIMSFITNPVLDEYIERSLASQADIVSVFSNPKWYGHRMGPTIKILNSFKSHKDSNILWDI
jgi:hypothetical protein